MMIQRLPKDVWDEVYRYLYYNLLSLVIDELLEVTEFEDWRLSEELDYSSRALGYRKCTICYKKWLYWYFDDAGYTECRKCVEKINSY